MLKGFNSTIWNALWILVPLGSVVFLLALCSLKKGHYYFFDPKHSNPRVTDAGNFEPHAKRYQELAKFVITLSAAAIAFLIGIMTSDKSAASVFTPALTSVAPIAVGFFAVSIAFLIAFMLLQAVWYEQYCHSSDHSTYKRWKYALNLTFGWTGLLSFVIGFVWLARNIFHR